MTFLTNEIQALQHQWKKCMDCKGDYVENKPHLITFHEGILISLWTADPHIYTICVWKVTRLVSQFILIPDNELHGFLFKVISLEFNACSYTSLILLSLGKRKCHMEQDQVNREVVFIWQCFLQPGTAWRSGCCEQMHFCGETDTISPATTLFSSCTLREAYTTGSPSRLVDWSSGPVTRTYCR